MKITIDTREESKEELRKLISFLQNLVSDSYGQVSNDVPPASEGAFNMFGAPSDDAEKKEDDEKEPESDVRIMEY